MNEEQKKLYSKKGDYNYVRLDDDVSSIKLAVDKLDYIIECLINYTDADMQKASDYAIRNFVDNHEQLWTMFSIARDYAREVREIIDKNIAPNIDAFKPRENKEGGEA